MGRSHAEAREILKRAWNRAMAQSYLNDTAPIPEPPTLGALQIAAGMGVTESSYGMACYTNKFTGVKRCDTNNWGAIQGSAVRPELGKTGGFEQSDFDAITGKDFHKPYQLYATPEDGAAHMLALLYRYAPEALQAGDIDGFSTQMYIGPHRGGTLENPKGYFGGFHVLAGKTGDARREAAIANINDRSVGLEKTAKAVAVALGELQQAVRGITPMGELRDPTIPGGDGSGDPFGEGAPDAPFLDIAMAVGGFALLALYLRGRS